MLAEVATKVEYELTIVTTQPSRYSHLTAHKIVDLKHSSGALKKIDILFIPCEAALKNGGAVARSGALMLAIAAKSRSIPVVAIATCYTLTNRFCF